MSASFEAKWPGVTSLAHDDDGVMALGGALVRLDGQGKPSKSLASGSGDALRVARFEDDWLVAREGQPSLSRTGAKKASAFAKGKSAVSAFVVGEHGVAVARAQGFELWSRAGKRVWSAGDGAFIAIAMVGDAVLALDEGGALVFASKKDGVALGTLRLASTDAPSTWRLVGLGHKSAVLALGEWLVWIDPATRKTQRRVRTRAKVRALDADGDWVLATCEDGFLQGFRAASGEPGAAFEIGSEPVAVAIGPKAIFTAHASGTVRAWDRALLEGAPRAASPISALTSRGDLVASGDADGRVRVLRGGREVGAFTVGQPVLAAFVDHSEGVVAAASRLAIAAPRPWDVPRPIALRGAATSVAADEAYLFAGTEQGSVDVFDLEGGAYVTSYALTDADVSVLLRLPGALLVVGTGALDGRLLVVDVAAAKVLHRVEAHEDAFGVTCLAADPRGRVVASGSDDGSVVLVDPARGRTLLRVDLRETPVSLAFEASGRKLLCALADGRAVLVTVGPKGATVADTGLRGVTRVAWGEGPFVGLRDGRIERLSFEVETSRPHR